MRKIITEEYHRVKLLERNKTGTPSENGNNAISFATGDYIILMCADDVFTNPYVVGDIVKIFQDNPKIGYVGRYYYQFTDNPNIPVRGFRHNNPYRGTDKWSGVAFRASCMPISLSEEIFVEATYLVKDILSRGWDYHIIKYDTIAVRSTMGDNGSQKPFCYIKSPMKNWIDCIGKEYSVLTNFISLIQIKNWGTHKALFREIWYFIKYRPFNILRLDFWFFALIAVLIPKTFLRPFTQGYKKHFLKYVIHGRPRNVKVYPRED